jgi:hypothetical protein
MDRAHEEWVATTLTAQLGEARNTQTMVTFKFEPKLFRICGSASATRRRCRHCRMSDDNFSEDE